VLPFSRFILYSKERLELDWKRKFYQLKDFPCNLLLHGVNHSFETWFGLVDRFRARIGPGWRKNKERRNSVDPARPDQKPGCNSLIFFLLKQCRFDFFKNRIDPDDPVTQSKPGIWVLDRAESKNYGVNVSKEKTKLFECINKFPYVKLIIFSQKHHGIKIDT